MAQIIAWLFGFHGDMAVLVTMYLYEDFFKYLHVHTSTKHISRLIEVSGDF